MHLVEKSVHPGAFVQGHGLEIQLLPVVFVGVHHLSGPHRDVVAVDGAFYPGVFFIVAVAVEPRIEVTEPYRGSVGTAAHGHLVALLLLLAENRAVFAYIHYICRFFALWVVDGFGVHGHSGQPHGHFLPARRC